MFKAWHAVRAKERQLAGLKKGAAPVVADLPEREEGRARDQAAKAVGVGGHAGLNLQPGTAHFWAGHTDSAMLRSPHAGQHRATFGAV